MHDAVGLDLKGVVRRRWRFFAAVAVPIAAAAGAVALALPATYRSQAVILVEDQQIPEEYVRATISGFVEERLQTLSQRILSRARLVEIVNRFGLHPELRDRFTVEEVLERVKGAIRVDTISAEVKDRRTGRPSQATIAFSVSYEGRDPVTVQRVASVLANLYLEENLATRERKVANTTAFLQAEVDDLKAQIAGLEGQISRFKRANLGALPEHTQLTLQSLERLARDQDQLEIRVRSVQERQVYLEGQLAGVEPLLEEEVRPATPRPPRRDTVETDPRERLRALKLQLVNLQTRVSDLHPDVRRLKREVADLEAEVARLGEAEEGAEALAARLAETRSRLGPQHPDVLALAREAEALAAVAAPGPAAPEMRVRPNPAHLALQSQLNAAALELESLGQERERLRQKAADAQHRLEQTPGVEREFASLTRDYENAKRKYADAVAKLSEARVAQGMEETQQGERFTVVDPAQLPQRPHRPNRLAIALIGVVLSLGAGVGAAAAAESLDRTVKSPEEAGALAGVPVLAVLPRVVTAEERRVGRVRTAAWGAAALAGVALGLAAVHHYVAPLDLVWLQVEQRIVKTVPR